ncbi:MAG: general secretion pathway protein M [Janthinobacterium sp.]|jgi:general secretion pathway protein M
MMPPVLNRMVQAGLGYKADASLFWDARSEQERQFLSLGAVLAVLLLGYALLFAPAMEGRAQLKKSLPQLRQQAAQLQVLAAQAASLNARAPVQVALMSSASLTSTLTARGLTAQSVGVTGEYAKLELRGIPFASLMQWLDGLRRESRISVQDANIVAQAVPGIVDATLTLHQPSGQQ